MHGRPTLRARIAAGGFLAGVDGNIAIITAIAAPLVLFVAAVTFDFSAMRNQDRQTQNAADLAAIAAAARLDKAEEIAFRTLAENGVGFGDQSAVDAMVTVEMLAGAQAKSSVEKGRYMRDAAIPIDQRFVSGAEPFNAVRVSVRAPATRYFTKGMFGDSYLNRTAVAYSSGEAAFSIGSRLASLNGGVMNAILGGLLGGSVSLSVMDYNALIDADVGLLSFLDQLAIEMDVTGGTYDDLLDMDARVGDIVSALAAVSRDASASRGAMSALELGLGASKTSVPLAGLFNLGSLGKAKIGGADAAADVVVSIYDLLGASAAVANGERQVDIGLDSSLAGLGELTLRVTVGEPMQDSPWYRIGEKGDVVHTAQTRLSFELDIGGTGLLAGAAVHLPIYVEAAYADGELTALDCESLLHPKVKKMEVAAKPGVVSAWIGDLDGGAEENFSREVEFRKATIVKSPLLTARGRSEIAVENDRAVTVSFTAEEVQRHAVKNVSTTSYAKSLVGSLLGKLDLEISAAGLTVITPTAVLAALAASLDPVTKLVDEAIFNTLSVLGIKVGEADIRASGAMCSRSVLVE